MTTNKSSVETDGHGWKRSKFWIQDRVLNEQRTHTLKHLITLLHCNVIWHMAKDEWWHGSVVSQDAGDVMRVYHVMIHSGLDAAIDVVEALDDAAKRKYPQWLREMAGLFVSPDDWNEEESLDGTR